MGCLGPSYDTAPSRCGGPDDLLYRNDVFIHGTAGNLTLDYPIPEDAKYEIGLISCNANHNRRVIRSYSNCTVEFLCSYKSVLKCAFLTYRI